MSSFAHVDRAAHPPLLSLFAYCFSCSPLFSFAVQRNVHNVTGILSCLLLASESASQVRIRPSPKVQSAHAARRPLSLSSSFCFAPTQCLTPLIFHSENFSTTFGQLQWIRMRILIQQLLSSFYCTSSTSPAPVAEVVVCLRRIKLRPLKRYLS